MPRSRRLPRWQRVLAVLGAALSLLIPFVALDSAARLINVPDSPLRWLATLWWVGAIYVFTRPGVGILRLAMRREL